MWTKQQLESAFRDLGLSLGDVVLVHSALRQLGPVAGGAETVIDALLATVGASGTVAVPTHTWKVVSSEQPVFHQALTPSNVGALTNVFRRRPEALRSLHPTHSIAAIGARAQELIVDHELGDTPFLPGGPYGRLREWGGKILIIGPGLQCCTYFHGCEEWAGCGWTGEFQFYSITAAGQLIPVKMRFGCCNTWDQYPNLEPGLCQIGALHIGHIGSCALHLLDAKPAADWVIARLREDPGIIFPNDI